MYGESGRVLLCFLSMHVCSDRYPGHFSVDLSVFFFFSSRRRHTRSVSAFLLNRSSDLITTILKRRGCLTVPRLTLMSLIKMMLVMVSVAAISKTFGLLRFLLRLSFLAK